MNKTLLIKVRCLLFLSVAFSISGTLSAQVKTHFSDFKAFTGETLLNEKSSLESSVYRLPLGTLKRKEGRLQPEFEKKLIGSVSHLTYEIGRDAAPSEVFQHYLDFFTQQKKYQTLYRCKSRACGSNNHWANVIFSQRALNGIVDTQRYVALRAPSSSTVDYIALYFVQRGNKKNYIHLDFIDVESDSGRESGVFPQVLTKGFVVLSGLSFSPEGEMNLVLSKKTLDGLIQWLSENPQLHLVVVGHSAQREDVDVAISQSKHAANNLLEHVQDHAKKGSMVSAKLSAYGVGPLAPGKTEVSVSSGFWLELVKVSP